MPAVLEALDWCDGLLLGSPVYFGLVSAQMKAMMDRTVCRGNERPRLLEGKVGGAIACGGFRNGGQELTMQCLHTFMLQWNMLVFPMERPTAIREAPRWGLEAPTSWGCAR
jgi:multimeric flavodoxin WrbA